MSTFMAEARNYAGLRDAIRARVDQLNISRECLDEVAVLAPGYSGKVLSRGSSKNQKRIGPLSLDLLLAATGLRLIVVEDEQALSRARPRYWPRRSRNVRSKTHWRNNGSDSSPREHD